MSRFRASACLAVSAVALLGIARADVERISLDPAGGDANGASVAAEIAGRGKFVVFESGATDLVADDTNAATDVFVRDLGSGTTVRVSVSTAGAEGNGSSFDASISDDGRWVSFVSGATNLVPDDTNGVEDVFVHDRKTGETRRVSVRSDGGEANDESYGPPQVSGNGRWVVFDSDATNLVAGDTNGDADVFVHDLKSGETIRASVGPAGEQLPDGHNAFSGRISRTGRFVAFTSTADVFENDSAQYGPVVRDMKTGRYLRPARLKDGGYADGSIFFWAMSANGKAVAYSSAATIVPSLGSTQGIGQVYHVNLRTGAITPLSLTPGGAPGNDDSGFPALSANGRVAAFSSLASNLVADDGNGAYDAFVADVGKGTLAAISRTPAGPTGNGRVVAVSLSSNGRTAVFDSEASDLTTGDGNGAYDVFLAPTR